MICNSYCTSDTCRVALVANPLGIHERVKERIVITSFVTVNQVMEAIDKTFEVTTLT
jgi:hypothetical protein